MKKWYRSVEVIESLEMVTNRTKRFINNGSCQNSLGEEHRLGITILSQSNLRFKEKDYFGIHDGTFILHNKS